MLLLMTFILELVNICNFNYFHKLYISCVVGLVFANACYMLVLNTAGGIFPDFIHIFMCLSFEVISLGVCVLGRALKT